MAKDNGSTLHRKNRRLVNEESKDPLELNPIVGYAHEPPASLHDACRALVGIVIDILKYVAIAIETTPHHPADGLTPNESAAVRLYTMEWTDDQDSLYVILNRTLREGDRTNLRPWFRYLKLFLSALVKIPCAPSQTVWRGVRRNDSDNYSRGTEVIWWSFSSCTTIMTVLENELYLGKAGERTLFSIEVFNARNLRNHSYFPNEEEILLLPGTYMEVRSKLDPATDLHIIHLKQMTPKTLLLEPPFEGAQLYPAIKQRSFCRRLTALITSHFTTFSKHSQHRKKNWFILISLLIMLCALAVILGSVLGTRSAAHNSSTGGDIVNSTNFQCAFNTLHNATREQRLDDLRKSAYKPQNVDEAAVFLAQVYHETDGLQTLTEYCAPGCGPAYATSWCDIQAAPGKFYHGRGWLRLTYPCNYNAAGKYLGLDLLNNPDLVSERQDVAVQTAVWFFQANNMVDPARRGDFAATTRILNGASECNGGPRAANQTTRVETYQRIRQCFGLGQPIINATC